MIKPALSEEELFMAKSLDQINKEKPLAMINFDYDKFDVREDAKSVLESNAAWMKKWRTAKILIEGHCDERGTEDYNLALGEKRAKSRLRLPRLPGHPGRADEDHLLRQEPAARHGQGRVRLARTAATSS